MYVAENLFVTMDSLIRFSTLLEYEIQLISCRFWFDLFALFRPLGSNKSYKWSRDWSHAVLKHFGYSNSFRALISVGNIIGTNYKTNLMILLPITYIFKLHAISSIYEEAHSMEDTARWND